MTRNPLISVSGLTKRFGGLTAVSDLSFAFFPGEILALIGPNGAGKTTTFDLIAGADAPSAGTIVLDGKRIDGLPAHRIAALGVMRTFQHNMFFPSMTLTDNVLVGRQTRFSGSLLDVLRGGGRVREQEMQARRCARDLISFVGLDHRLHDDVSALSFGEGRLLELARALAGEPRAILLDEPAAGLTLSEVKRLGKLIRDIAARGIAVLLIDHDMHFIFPLADRVVVLNFGRKIADAPPTDIVHAPEVICAYLGSTQVSVDQVSVDIPAHHA